MRVFKGFFSVHGTHSVSGVAGDVNFYGLGNDNARGEVFLLRKIATYKLLLVGTKLEQVHIGCFGSLFLMLFTHHCLNTLALHRITLGREDMKEVVHVILS